MRNLVRYCLGVSALEPYVRNFFEPKGMLRPSPRGFRVRLDQRPSTRKRSDANSDQIEQALASARLVASAVVRPHRIAQSGTIVKAEFVEAGPKTRRGVQQAQRNSAFQRRGPDFHLKRPAVTLPARPQARPAVAAPAPPNTVADEATGPAGSRPHHREITVTGHELGGGSVSRFRSGATYKLRFCVGPPLESNLAKGGIGVDDVPQGGLRTHWVVTSRTVEFVPAFSSASVQRVGSAWMATFELLIPESGTSRTEEIAFLAAAGAASALVTIYAVAADGVRELYREVSVDLEQAPVLEGDTVCKAPQHTHLASTHEWTTPPEHVQVTVTNGVAVVTTKRRWLEDYEFTEPFGATDGLISGAIQNVRTALERLREVHGAYLNDLDEADMAARLRTSTWQPHFSRGNGWQPLPDDAGPAHGTAFAVVHRSDEWRTLAANGYALFDRCFAQGTQLRALIEKLLPGSRIDFHWTERSGPGWVSHVPWALMYMDAPDVTGQTQADPERFLGLRFRIGARAWRIDNGSVVLGAPDATRSMHLLYWGNQPGDEVAAESRWQEMEYRKWSPSVLLPDPALPDLKRQVVLALDTPAPEPVGILYFYCHCSVGDGIQPCLRFGNTSKAVDVLSIADLSQKRIADAPIVFANACTTAQADPHLTSELEQRFFSRGVRAFIGTETRVPTRLASKLAWLFFQFLHREADPERKPMSAGEALTQARMFLWTQYRNIGGLFYSITNQYDLYLASREEVLALRS